MHCQGRTLPPICEALVSTTIRSSGRSRSCRAPIGPRSRSVSNSHGRELGGTSTPPFMRMVTSTGIGFVLSPVPAGLESQAQNGLANFVAAHMYERRVTRCIGAALVDEGSSRFIWWMMVDQPWKYNPEMEAFLREHPLSDVRESLVPRYKLFEEE